MKKNIWLILVLLIVCTSWSAAQYYEVNARAMPLSDLLIELRAEYGLQFSFDHQLLSSYRVTLTGTFYNSDHLMERVLKDFPLAWERVNGVYVIFPGARTPGRHVFSGRVMETGSGEPLPFSHIVVEGTPLVSDVKGYFSYQTETGKAQEAKISHLGCYVLDTLLQPGREYQLFLTPFSYRLPEVKVVDTRVERSVQLGESAGLIKLTPYIARYLPGNGDNSLFDLLRLQPGILAAGEQPNDLIIHGSPEGTSRVFFDDMILWGLKNFNDNIGAVNPFVAKSILVYKSGYDASHADVAGGIVDIAGKTGNLNKPAFNLFVNNQTVNTMVELPMFQKTSLLVAFRQTWKDLFSRDDLNLPERMQNEGRFVWDVDPDYRFRDMNAKYSIHGDNGDLFYLSFLRGNDSFSYGLTQERERNIFSQTSGEDNLQTGVSAFYGKTWNNGSRSTFTASRSGLNSEYRIRREIENKRSHRLLSLRNDHSDTRAESWHGKLEHHPVTTGRHEANMGIEGMWNKISWVEDTFEVTSSAVNMQGWQFTGYLQDKIRIAGPLWLKAGVRVNYPALAGKIHVDPRLELSLKWNALVKVNAAWGRYHQYLVKSSVVDESGNYRYFPALAGARDVPAPEAEHWVGGITLQKNGYTVSTGAWYKQTSGLTRYVRWRARQAEDVFSGKSRSFGLDMMVKRDYGPHSFWATWTVGRADEKFSYFPDEQYRRAPHDQRHELKVAGLLKTGKFFWSGAWVYGTGFPLYTGYLNRQYTEPDYNRLDLSVTWRLLKPRFQAEAGFSVLNVFDVQNVKYSSFERIPVDQLNTIYINTEAVPFTPLVFLKVAL